MAKKMTKKAKSALVNKAYGKVGFGRPVPIMSLGTILRAGETALESALAFHLPMSEDEIKLTVEMALEREIAKVEVTS